MKRLPLIAALLMWAASPARAADLSEEPVLALSLNLGLSADAVPGAPLIVTGRLATSGPAGVSPLVIAPAVGTWVDALELVLSTADGSRVAAPFALAGVASGRTIELAGRASVHLLWTLSAEATASLAPGRYSLRARLAVPRGEQGSWAGAVESPPLPFGVPKPSGSEDAAQRRARVLLAANLAAVDGNLPGAESGLRALIRQNPECVAAHRLLAEVLLARGASLEAFLAANDAARLWAQANPEAPLPPPEIADVGQRAIRRLLATAPPAAPPPARPAAPAGSAATPAATSAPAPSGRQAPASSSPPQGAPRPPAVPGSLPSQSPTPPTRPAAEPPGPKVEPVEDPKAKALREYEEVIRKGDALMAAGDFFEAVRVYEQAWRIRYNNKLGVAAAELDDRLSRARKARDEKKKH